MKHQWYKSSFTKGLLVIAEHILLVTAVVSFLWLAVYPMLKNEIFTGNSPDTYEETTSFTEQLRSISQQVVSGIGMCARFETDGKYDPDKIVDIQDYYEKSEIRNENVNGLSYRLQDLVDWGDKWIQTGEESSYEGGDSANNIIVCKKTDNTYHYYYYNEFKSLIDNGDLRFVIASDEAGISEEDILDELQNGNFYNGTETAFKGLQDSDGKIAYIDCWNYDGLCLKEEYLTVDGKSIVELANENPLWNGRLSDAYNMLRDSIYQIDAEMGQYEDLDLFYKEGDTNLAYLYVDTDAKKVYTNRKAFQDYDQVNKNLDKFRKMGKYAVIKPELADFETNLDHIDAEEWRSEVKSTGNKESGFIYAVGVDTDYPIKDSFYTEAELYDKYGAGNQEVLFRGFISFILFLVILVWLTVVAGRSNKDKELHLIWFDRWKTELSFAIVVTCWIAPIIFVYVNSSYFNFNYGYEGYELYQYDYVSNSIPYVIAGGVLAAYTCTLFLIGYLSLIRRAKAKILWKNSILKWIGDFIRDIVCHMHAVWKVIIVFGIIWLFTMYLTYEWGSVMYLNMAVFFGIQGAELAAFIYMVKQAIGRQRIKKGIYKIAGGEVDYKIPLNGLESDQKTIAEKINSIGEGLDTALEKNIKNERLKTDLITNVSHDIKTPLTSIINYVELLKQENFEDPKIQRYIEVLEQKSQRLKTLTEDVVEASKVSSGNITLEYMNINLVEMIQQTSGEFEEKFKARDLEEILCLPEYDIIIRADGRRLWRVLSNIYNNAAKYAMRGTRVYATLEKQENTAVFSLKNISEQPLNIPATELTERFIRGDVSRSTEGSGLGLSIAQSLTEMQGGKFELYLDGDLFKVTIMFPLSSQT